MKTRLARVTAKVRQTEARVRGWVQRFLLHILFLLAVVGAIGVAVFVFERSGLPDTTEDRSAVIRNVGLVIGGMFALWVAVWRSRVADRQAKAAQREADTGQQRLRGDRLQQGAAMLASELLPVRLAGIHALQRLAEDHPDEYHIQIMRLLCAFVRQPIADDVHEASVGEEDKPPSAFFNHRLREDVQAAIEAVSACHERHYIVASDAGFNLDLRGADLRSAKLERLNSVPGKLGNLGNSPLREQLGRRLWLLATWPTEGERGAFLLGADLTESLLDNAQLDRSSLSNARLIEAQLTFASLRDADLTAAKLSGANLALARLGGASLAGATLDGADLTNASLADADLSGATFFADGLFKVPAKGLTQAQLDQARADPDKPPRLDRVVDAETGAPLVWRGKPLEDTT
ncbi:MAG: pentapeptide repeat-containing protein [Chloroflexi bacterium]|nr:pentapeptide repeat-containing protein [Chloroflexota bacterium]